MKKKFLSILAVALMSVPLFSAAENEKNVLIPNNTSSSSFSNHHQTRSVMLPSFKAYFDSGCINIVSYKQGWGELIYNRDFLNEGPVKIAGRIFETGISSHANCEIRIKSGYALRHFKAHVGISDNSYTRKEENQIAPMDFSVVVNGRAIGECKGIVKQQVAVLECDFPKNVYDFTIKVESSSIRNGHISLGNVRLELANGHCLDPFAFVTTFNMAPAPVTFKYGDSYSEDFFHKYPLSMSEESSSGEDNTYVLLSEGEGFQVRMQVKEYGKYPVWEWHTTVKNTGAVRSKRLSQVNVLKFSTSVQKEVNYAVHRRRGSQHEQREDIPYSERFIESYKPVIDRLRDLETLTLRNEGGRPTVAWLPCIDLSNDHDDSLRFVIGWAGQWRMKLSHTEANSFAIEAGLEDLDAVLEPGEELTLPSVFLLREACSYEKMVNIWRRFVTEKVMMPLDGKVPQSHVSIGLWGGMNAEEHMAHAQSIVKHDLPCEVYWIDAGWYAPHSKDAFEPVWVKYVGDWKFHPEQYPNELIDLSKYLHDKGRKLLLWFEPERVRVTSTLAKEHPEWLISLPGSGDMLLNLGNSEAWNWCYDTLAGIIRRNHLDWYREDFNIEPLPYWRANDTPDRKGITEIKFNEGLYRLWSSLRKEFPHLMIDNCASGGRRLDIELLRYSVPLWMSDMQCDNDFDAEWSLAQCVWLGTYWPRLGTSTGLANNLDVFTFRSTLCNYIAVQLDYGFGTLPDEHFSCEQLKKCIQQHKNVRDVIGCDFYELSPVVPHGQPWAVLQYDSPESRKGAIFAFRSGDSNVVEYAIRPKALLAEAMYEVTDVDGRFKACHMKGDELMRQGISLRLPARCSDIIQYRQL